MLEAGIKEKRALAASVLSTSVLPTVVIDAGHGGTDRGTKSKTPFCEEKRVCLQTARLVKKYLDQLGYHVVMTRTTDAFVSLGRRVEIAAQAGSSVFVSIHYNSARNPTAQGMEVFFYDSKEDRLRTIASKKLAESILPNLIRRTNAVSRGVKKGNYFVLRENTMPAIIVEGGFISNPHECALLKSIDYQDQIARGIADGIDRYLKMNTP
jgi:N-acetylmuramoyl-L-alanine amidase